MDFIVMGIIVSLGFMGFFLICILRGLFEVVCYERMYLDKGKKFKNFIF